MRLGDAMGAIARGLLMLLLCGRLAVAAEPLGAGGRHSGAAVPDSGRQAGRAHPGAGRAAAPRLHGHTVPDAPINVNTASAATLVALKGVGEKKARAIIAYRKAHGPFDSLDDFEEVPGIGPALIEANRDRILFR